MQCLSQYLCYVTLNIEPNFCFKLIKINKFCLLDLIPKRPIVGFSIGSIGFVVISDTSQPLSPYFWPQISDWLICPILPSCGQSFLLLFFMFLFILFFNFTLFLCKIEVIIIIIMKLYYYY